MKETYKVIEGNVKATIHKPPHQDPVVAISDADGNDHVYHEPIDQSVTGGFGFSKAAQAYMNDRIAHLKSRHGK